MRAVLVMTLLLRLAGGIAALAAPAGMAEAGPLQAMIDAAAENATVKPAAGVYHDHIVIRKPVILDGSAGVVIDGDGEGTVMEIATSGAILKGVTLRNSGRLHTKIDAGLRITGNFNVIKDVTIENSLFGIDLHEANGNVLRRNRISSNDLPPGLRGDSIRLWYSHNNEITANYIHDARDFTVWYSHDNTIADNTIRRGRYGIHFMYSHRNRMTGNEIADCVVGVFLMYSNQVEVRNNKFLRAWGASGVGVGFKESSEAVIADNEIIGNAVGIYLDISPFDPESTNAFTGNKIGFNGIGVSFHTDWEGNIFENNAFLSNFTQVSVDGGGTALRETWKNNYWDDYSGFDRNGDGRGDSPFEIYNYADRLWMEVPSTSFFRGSPALEMLDLIERLAPFSEPKLLVREPGPLMEEPALAAAVAPKSALEMPR